MSRKKVVSRMLSMVVVTGMLMVSVPDAWVLAGDDSRDTFVITEFQDLDSWKPETTAFVRGTPVSRMEFPETWKVTGYLEKEGSGALEERELKDLEWVGILKDQEDEKEGTEDPEPILYTEQSEAGIYDFTVKLPSYMKMAEGIDVPKIPITITREGTDPNPKIPKGENGSGGEILKFFIGNTEGSIDKNTRKITVSLPHGMSAVDLAPDITVGMGETVSPASGVKQDFTNPVTYTVYGTDGTSFNTYQVEVKTDPHIWQEATCEEPKTCTLCGKTEGTALGHTWKEATCETPKTCTVCGKTEGTALGHTWKEATCETPKTCTVCGKIEGMALGHSWKEATCEAPKTCTVCGKTEGPALGHTWKEATCETPKTCTVCGKTEGPALGHSWKNADCTHPKTCTVCGKTEGQPLGHQWSEWVLIQKPTTDAQGVEERICVPCQLKETRQVQRLNRIGDAKNNKVTGIKANGVYGVGEHITIKAEGAWMDNKDPIQGDVRYVPEGWKVTSDNSFKDATYQVTFEVRSEGNYTLQVSFRKQKFDGTRWINEKETDTRTINFTISRNKAIPVKTGDDTMGAGWAAVAFLALAAMFLGIRQRKHRDF